MEDHQIDMVMEAIGLIGDRVELVAQAAIYNCHETNRILAGFGLVTEEEAITTVEALASDLGVAVTIVPAEEEVHEQTQEEG